MVAKAEERAHAPEAPALTRVRKAMDVWSLRWRAWLIPKEEKVGFYLVSEITSFFLI
jgi:hypothetical protein